MAAFSLLVDILFERAERKQDMGVSDLTAGIEGWFRLMQRGLAGNLAGSDLFCFRISLVLIIAALLVLIYGCVQLLILENQKKHQAELRQSILGSMLISANTFLGNWKTTKSGNKVTGGYKTMDQPGCYVIVTSPSPDGTAFENVYVGQSLHVCSRVRNHLTGHGNGDVYADVRNGKPVFVKIAPCSPQQMNALEKSLIKAFNATSSYNNTAGGSRRR